MLGFRTHHRLFSPVTSGQVVLGTSGVSLGSGWSGHLCFGICSASLTLVLGRFKST